METRRILIAAVSLLASATAHADVAMALSADKLFYQVSPLKVNFEVGRLAVAVRDGFVTFDAACVIDPQLFFFGPSNIPPCPLGATAYIASGDVDGDGVRDDNLYWSVASVIPALVIEPGRPELCQLYSAPPSKLPRPLNNFNDDSVVIFFDISTTFVQQLDQSRYNLVRDYGSVRQVETALVPGDVIAPGTINAVVTSADIVGSPLTVTFNVVAADTAADWAAKLRTALNANAAINAIYIVGGAESLVTLTERVANGNDSSLNIALQAGTGNAAGLPANNSFDTQVGSFSAPAAALKQMNDEIVPGQYVFTFPRLDNPDLNPVAIPVTIVPILEGVNPAARSRAGFRFTTGSWRGDIYQMDPRTITVVRWVGNDRTVVRPGDQLFFSVLNEAENFLLFPPTVPQNPVFLATPTTQQYTIPPYFFDIGEKGVMEIRYERTLFTSGISFDGSTRLFRAKVEMVDSFPGYMKATLPAGTASREYGPKANFDRDSMTNIEEYAYQFPTNEDITASVREQFVPLATDIPFGVPAVTSEFNRVLTRLPEPILDPNVQPVGPGAPTVNGAGQIVFEAPFRPRTGNTLRYSFGFKEADKKKLTPIKIGKGWTQDFRTVTSTRNVLIEIKLLDADGSTVAIIQRPGFTGNPTGAMTVTLTQSFIRITSDDPAPDPLNLPAIGVNLTPSTLK